MDAARRRGDRSGGRGRRWATAGVGLAAATLIPLGVSTSAAAHLEDRYRQTNLVSDIGGVARVTDTRLINPWGLVHGPSTPWWVSDNNSGISTLYDGSGHPFPVGSPLTVTIPPPAGGTSAAPTGVVFNGGTGFVVTNPVTHVSGPAAFIFATEDGTIAGWSGKVDVHNAILEVDRSADPTPADGAVYKGLELVHTGAGDNLLAANFRAGTVEVFDSGFHRVVTAGAFADATIPAGFAPFNIAAVGHDVYVSYARQNAARHDDTAGPGNGFINVFDTAGRLEKRLASGGALNSPWGMTVAPDGFGDAGGKLLVGNFGDGHIDVYSPKSGRFEGALADEDGLPITIGGLWGLAFGNGALAGPRTTLFFTAGIGEEQHGLFGTVRRDDG